MLRMGHNEKSSTPQNDQRPKNRLAALSVCGIGTNSIPFTKYKERMRI